MTQALTTGVNQLTQGVVYALPGFPCQILSSGWMATADGTAILGTMTVEPGNFFDGGTIQGIDGPRTVVVKKHTIGGKSGAATSYSAAVLMDKPSYYWRLNDPLPLARELRQGLHGTISGGVTAEQPGALVDGDKCMVFDGVSGWIGTSALVSTPRTMTVEAWIKLFSTTGNFQAIFSNRSATGNASSIFFGVNNAQLAFYSEGAGNISSLTPMDLGWHHVVAVHTNNTTWLYVDGKLDITGPHVRTVDGSGNGAIGVDGSPVATLWFKGSIDEVAIYPYALSPAQISQHYKARSSPFIASGYASQVIQSNPSNYWRLGETYGTVAKDVIGGADGTISGGVTLGTVGAIGDGDKAMTFDGTTGKVITTAATYAIPLVSTIEMWIKTTISAVAFSNRTAGADKPLIGVYQNVPYAYADVNPGLAQGTRVVTDGQWHHLIYVVNGSTIAFYVDGIFDRSQAWPRPSAPLDYFSIGHDLASGFFNGQIDDVAIYPRALSAAEILDHYKAR